MKANPSPTRILVLGNPLPRRCIELLTYRDDIVLAPFMGSGTTAIAAVRTGRKFIGYETDIDYLEKSYGRVRQDCGGPAGMALQAATGWDPPASNEQASAQ